MGLSKEPDARLRAALAFELAALTEQRLEDRAGALQIYREARDHDPLFRPALYALARLLAGTRDFDELARVLASTVNASPLPAERAAALVGLGCLFEDQLNDAAAAADSFERALHADPACLPAASMLERSLRALGREQDAEGVTAGRTAHTFDPHLRSVLACETARAQAARGQLGHAVETLLAAVAVRGRCFSTLLELAELATEHHLPTTGARAYEDAATMLAAHAAGQAGPDSDDISGRLPAANGTGASHAMTIAAFLYRRAGQSFLAADNDTEQAKRVLERACASQRSELVLHMEYADVCQAVGDFAGARTGVHALLDRAPPPRAAALQFRLAELAQHAGDAPEAENRLRAGLALDPESPVLRAALEDAWIDSGKFAALSGSLEARADRGGAEDRRIALMRAAETADAQGDLPRALALYRRCAESSAEDPVVLRELYGAALRGGDAAAVREVCSKLLALQLSAAERSALWRSRYDADLALSDYPAALATLRAALEDPTCDSWAGHSAWLLAGQRGDFALLAAAHQGLADRNDDSVQAAAHVAAAGRAWLRLGDHDKALECFRRVLDLSPTDAYAVAMLEALLLSRDEPAEALQLLRDTAAAERDEQRSELALLRAGAAAEAAGRFDLAAPSYEDAVDRSPDSLAALWARLRLAERSHDVALGTRSLRALAARELAGGQPGISQLELAERLDVLGEWSQALGPLSAAFGGEQVAYEAAASAILAPRASDSNGEPRALRVQAFGKLAQHATPALRPALEHEQVAELQYDAPPDARTLLIARTEHAPLGFGDELLAFLLSEDAGGRRGTLANLARLDPDPAARAELALHAMRTETLHGAARDDDELVSALGMLEEAPESLAAAVALGEALTEQDAAELRVTAALARLRHTPPALASSLEFELLRAYLEADRAADALALARKLLARDQGDLSAWDGLREAARRAGEWKTLIEACDKLAEHSSGSHRASLLEEAASVLHDVLRDPAAAEARLRAGLAAEPARASLFERLHDLLLEQGDLAGLVDVLGARVAISESSEEKVELSYSKARILRALGRRTPALECIGEVLAADPGHAGALSLSAEIHASEHSWEAAVAALDALAQSDVPSAQRRLAREGAADFLEHKLKDPAAAYEQLARIQRDGFADLAVFTRMADVAQRANLTEQAVAALSQAAAHSGGTNRAGFERRAAIIYGQSLNRPADARDALLRALSADPLDIDALEALHAAADPGSPELTSSEMFLHELWGALRSEPSEPRLLRTLARCARLRADRTLEYLALSALNALGLAHGEEQSATANLRDQLASLPSGVVSDTQFALLGGPTHAHAAFRVARAVSRAGLELMGPKPDTGRRTRLRDTSQAFTVVSRLVKTFGLTLAELHQGDGGGRDVLVWPRSNQQLACLLAPSVELPLTAAVRFSLGAQCAALRLGVLPLVQAERSSARDLLYAALCSVPGAPQPADAARLRPLAVELGKKMSRKERRELESGLAELPEPLAALNEVGEDARAGAYRAGALLAQDLAPALVYVFGEHYNLDTLVNSKLGLRLLRFWTSQTCLALLRGLGMTA